MRSNMDCNQLDLTEILIFYMVANSYNELYKNPPLHLTSLAHKQIVLKQMGLYKWK